MAMIDAGKIAIDANGGEGDDEALKSDAIAAYKAMVAAAPCADPEGE